MSFDTAKSKLSQNNYKAADFQLHTHVNNGTGCGGYTYQKINENTETSTNLVWTARSNNTHFGITAKYKLACKTSLSAKINNASLIGLGNAQTGVKLTLWALVDGKNFNAGHKVGLKSELEA